MIYAASKAGTTLTPKDRERLAPLRALDKRIIEVVRKGHIGMLDADYLRSGKITKMLRRQDMPKEAFLAPKIAAAHIEEGLRKAGALTYGCAPPALSNPRPAPALPLAARTLSTSPRPRFPGLCARISDTTKK